MKKILPAALAVLLLTACSAPENSASSEIGLTDIDESAASVTPPTEGITELEKGLSSAEFSGNYCFDEFLKNGGASTDEEVMKFLSENLLGGNTAGFSADTFGCSTVSAKGQDGYFFGRNFDWYNCDALVVTTHPESGYDSVSTVNLDFIGAEASQFTDKMLTIAAIYAPLDGMNEKGLCVSVNMIQDFENTRQNTEKPDITTTTAVRLLLDKAADTDEAIDLLSQYDMHFSKGLTVHFAAADAMGRSVAIEYVDGEMIVTETPVVTNFYFAEGEKKDIGTEQSHERYKALLSFLDNKDIVTAEDMKKALDSVSKHNYDDGETTEWSVVFDQQSKTAQYYHRENYEKAYEFEL